MLRSEGLQLDATHSYDSVEQGTVFWNGDDTQGSISFATDGTNVDANWLRRRTTNVLSTGILDGGVISSDGTDIIISAGDGVVTDNYTDTDNPSSIRVVWDDMTTTTPYFYSHAASYLKINTAGSLSITATAPSLDDHRDNIILGSAGHFTKFQIDYVIQHQHPGYDPALNLWDFVESFGVFNIDGNVYGPDGTDTTLNMFKSAGQSFGLGLNYANSKKRPCVIDDNTQSPVGYVYAYLDGTDWAGSSFRTQVDSSTYNSGIAANDGELSPLPDGSWSIQPLFYFPQTTQTILQYGQTVYDTYEHARTGVADSFALSPSNENAVFRGWLLMTSDTTDLNDISEAEFVAASKFGLTSSVSGGSTGGEANIGQNVGSGGVGPYFDKNGVTLEFKNINAGSSKITVTEDVPNKEIDIDVVPSNIDLNDLGDINAPSPSNGDGILWDSTSSKWLSASFDLSGATGVAGTTGVDGVQGQTGVEGAQGTTGAGIQGVTGVDGIQGQTGAGIQGETGIIGLQGETGIQGTTGLSIGSLSKIFQGIDATGDIFLTPDATAIPWNYVTLKDDYYSHSTSVNPEEVTILQDGLYKLSAQITVSSRGTTGGQRGNPHLIFDIYTDGTWVTQPDSLGGYIRENAAPLATSLTGIGIFQFYANQKIRVAVYDSVLVHPDEATNAFSGRIIVEYKDRSGTSSGTVDNLKDIGDVFAPAPSEGQALIFDSTASQWRAGAAAGAQGLTGVQGTTGSQGSTGAGIQGTTGVQGIQGTTGIQGETGVQGIQGTTGIQGTQGDTGVMGLPGEVAGASLYLHEEASDIGGYERLLRIPSDDPENTEEATVNSTDGLVQIEPYATDSDYPGEGIWPSGTWEFHTYASIDSATGDSRIVASVYRRDTTGNESFLFDSTTAEIDSLTPLLYTHTKTTSDFTGASDDRLVVKYGTYTSSVSDRDVTLYYEGQDHYTYIKTPLRIAGLQGETGVQGTQGETGVQGIQGQTGAGIQGETGAQGTDGETGAQGIQGQTGAGIQGETGVAGVQGETGVQGIQGIQGQTGAGIQGDTGVQGIEGPTPAYKFFADQMDSPNNADWAVGTPSPASADTTNNALTVRRFDDTDEEGIGFLLDIPSDATNVVFGLKSRAETAPASAHNVQPRIYTRNAADNVSVGTWTDGANLTVLSMPTNTNFQYDSESVALSTIDATAGNLTQVEMTRYHTGVTTDLTGDWDLLELAVSFT